MHTSIRAKIAKRNWLDWASSSLQNSLLEDSEADLALKKIKMLRQLYPTGVSYELPRVSILRACEIIGELVSGIEPAFCIAGDPPDPAIFRLGATDLHMVLIESARLDKTIAFAPAQLDGLLIIDMPSDSSHTDLLISGCGSLEAAIVRAQQLISGGRLFRGN